MCIICLEKHIEVCLSIFSMFFNLIKSEELNHEKSGYCFKVIKHFYSGS